jgi:hypothetical protein
MQHKDGWMISGQEALFFLGSYLTYDVTLVVDFFLKIYF